MIGTIFFVPSILNLNEDKSCFMIEHNLTVRLASPRGFCAGVDRAIQIVEECLKKYGSPVYVRHEIVHNRFVVESLEAKGAIFVDELEEVPAGVPVIFSAHGVPKAIPKEAERRNLVYLDATCPLVSKVHIAAERHYRNDRHIILIGHAGHPEVIGTMGQLPNGAISLVETINDVPKLCVPKDKSLAYITQTTLSLDDTKAVIEALEGRFPNLIGPAKQDICYATTNRQQAVKTISIGCDALIVIGAPNSSNSKRLVEVAAMNGCPDSRLIQRASDIEWNWLATKKVLGVTAGASAPEVLVEEVLQACKDRFNVTVEEVTITREDVIFKLPKELAK